MQASDPTSTGMSARQFALHRLAQAAQAGLLGNFNPAGAKDPAAVWRALSASISQNPDEMRAFLEVAHPQPVQEHLPQPSPQPLLPVHPPTSGPPMLPIHQMPQPTPAPFLPGAPIGALPHSMPNQVIGGPVQNLGTPGLAQILAALRAGQVSPLLRYA